MSPSGDVQSIDDYAKVGGREKSYFCVVFTMSLCMLKLTQMLISLLFQVILKLRKQALKSYLEITCEYQLHILPTEKLVPQRIMIKTT